MDRSISWIIILASLCVLDTAAGFALTGLPSIDWMTYPGLQGANVGRGGLNCKLQGYHRRHHMRLSGAMHTKISMGETRPKLIFDVMSTLVFDPYLGMPKFLGLEPKELWAAKDPEAWLAFERGEITEEEFFRCFFSDRREWDGPGLRQMLFDGYEWLPGIEDLLQTLQSKGYEMHILSNYPIWWKSIESKLVLSKYLQWTFVSCNEGVRKPDEKIYSIVSERLNVTPDSLIFVDDNAANVQAANALGWKGILFESAPQLARELADRGVEV